ncbi:MAG: 16S rRNA (cytosine(1402)-N(4))-methyltransferase RsmH [Bacteroidota bacterium]|nr:16S rRNA (cytosine(1402)-N(4))-methyltransferase RsmH [Bacteroidota bacterium]
MSYEYHTPVLVEKVLEYLITKPDGVYVDATLGGGGHSEKILERLLPTGVLIGIDADKDALDFSKMRFGERVLLVQSNFSHLSQILSEHNLPKVDGFLFDLGISSRQIDSAQKGFSFSSDAKLDMRFDSRQELDAHYIVNSYSEEELSRIFWQFGEEKFSRRIAKKIVDSRTRKSIDTTLELAEIVKSVVSGKFLNKSLARIFQAIRIEVNRELESLQSALKSALMHLNPAGRLVVISYHSLEDRIVKSFFREFSTPTRDITWKLTGIETTKPLIRVLTKKPILPEETEIVQNPRSRSAKLRVAERLND